MSRTDHSRLWERGEREMRVWSADALSGEEPYSIGILMPTRH
jgi:chemotaxis methyl-accepting protein methylase